ncbi:MAG: hypothetical protein H6509_07455 [Bryobacterales bacterium]|nr:hypothetical protein [Acidobacteriota bacterium]MCB9384434.1 hypothetical protein [Bryobacterales bacterium]
MAKKTSKPIKLSKAQMAEYTLATTEAIHEYERVVEARTPSFSKVRAVTLEASAEYEGVPEGCVVGYFATEGNKTLDAIYEAAKAGDLKKLDQLHSRLAASHLKQLESLGDKPVGIAKTPLWGELRYRSKTISRALLAETAAWVDVRFFPYNGGKLFDDDFSLVNFPLSANRKLLTGVLLKRPPQLSALESEILSQIPREGTESNIGVESGIFGHVVRAVAKATKKVVVATVDAAKRAVNWVTENKTAVLEATMLTYEVATMATGGCPVLPGATVTQSIKPSSSAADLLAIRREALLAQMPEL